MKKHLFFFTVWLLLSGCIGGEPGELDSPPTDYEPLLMTREQLEQSVRWKEPTPLQRAGKIYVYRQFLFINERFRGVHVYDNSDPREPVNLGFIQAPGNIDIAVKNNFIYLDNAVDLVTLRWYGDSIQVLDRDVAAFPEFQPPDGGFYNFNNRPNNTVVVEWQER